MSIQPNRLICDRDEVLFWLDASCFNDADSGRCDLGPDSVAFENSNSHDGLNSNSKQKPVNRKKCIYEVCMIRNSWDLIWLQILLGENPCEQFGLPEVYEHDRIDPKS